MTLNCVVFRLQGHYSVMLILFLSIHVWASWQIVHSEALLFFVHLSPGHSLPQSRGSAPVRSFVIQEPGGYCWDIASHKIMKVTRSQEIFLLHFKHSFFECLPSGLWLVSQCPSAFWSLGSRGCPQSSPSGRSSKWLQGADRSRRDKGSMKEWFLYLIDQSPPGNLITFLCLPRPTEPDCCPGRGNCYSDTPHTLL